MNILADATLPGLDEAFPAPFNLSRYTNPAKIASLLPKQDVLFCRSTLKVDSTLLKNHHLHYVATASSGTDHLDSFWLASQNIQIIDAKGCNAQAVADYVVACLAYLSQQHLIYGTKAGIIGMGLVGARVNARLQAAGFQTVTYDPLKAGFQSCELEQLYQTDILCIHAELHDSHPFPSTNLINHQFLAHLKPGCILINAARGGIVNEEDMLNTPNEISYCTDVYLNEPAIDKRIINKATLCTPHIAGHSLEAKYAAVSMVSKTLHQIIGLPQPQFAKPERPQTLTLQQDKSWQELILTLYNPHAETVQLKQALDKESAFLNLRRNHQQRHDFSVFSDSIANQKIRLLIGC